MNRPNSIRHVGTGDINPLRYRGYVYDRETGLYYLQSRYYDPEIGRFINADAFTSTGQGLVGNNMFAYCGNNPISYIDSSGALFEKNPGGGGGGVSVSDIRIGGGGHIYIPQPSAKTDSPLGIPYIPHIPPSTTSNYDEARAETIAIRNNSRANQEKQTKADARIRAIVTNSSKVRYWTATIQGLYVDIGRPLTYSQAVKEVTAGRNVFTVTWWEAKAVAIAAGGRTGANNKSLIPEFHGTTNSTGYYYHYHTYNRKGGHVFYLFGCL